MPESVERQLQAYEHEVASRSPSVHEQTDGTVLAVVMTGSGSRYSLQAWVRYLTRTNPKLADIPVVFKLRTPASGVVVHDGYGQFDIKEFSEETQEQDRKTKTDVPVLYVDYS